MSNNALWRVAWTNRALRRNLGDRVLPQMVVGIEEEMGALLTSRVKELLVKGKKLVMHL
jgi:hypothetical protein